LSANNPADYDSGKENAVLVLTAEQHHAIATTGAQPVRAIDPATQTEYVLVRAEIYDRIKNLVSDDAGRLETLRCSNTHSPETLEQRFRRLAMAWKAGRYGLSTAKRMATHPAYQELIAMGEAVVPLIIAELEREPDHWFIALHTITGASPVPEESRGNLAAMSRAWADWWREKTR
jgi:hypothetical protein